MIKFTIGAEVELTELAPKYQRDKYVNHKFFIIEHNYNGYVLAATNPPSKKQIKVKNRNGYSAEFKANMLKLYSINDKSSILRKIESAQRVIQGKNDDIEKYKKMLDFLELTNNEEFDNNLFKIYNSLQSINNDLNDIEKAKIINDTLKIK